MIKTDIQIRFSDLDMLGHVNNIVLQQYYDLGKMQYFTEVLDMPPLWKAEAFITVNTNTDYYEEVRIGDTISVTTKISTIGTKSIIFVQEIVDEITNIVKSCSHSVLVAFNLNTRESFDIREELRSKVIDYEKEIIIKK